MIEHATTANASPVKRHYAPSADRVHHLPIPRPRREEPALSLRLSSGGAVTRRADLAQSANVANREHAQAVRVFAASVNGHAQAVVFTSADLTRP